MWPARARISARSSVFLTSQPPIPLKLLLLSCWTAQTADLLCIPICHAYHMDDRAQDAKQLTNSSRAAPRSPGSLQNFTLLTIIRCNLHLFPDCIVVMETLLWWRHCCRLILGPSQWHSFLAQAVDDIGSNPFASYGGYGAHWKSGPWQLWGWYSWRKFQLSRADPAMLTAGSRQHTWIIHLRNDLTYALLSLSLQSLCGLGLLFNYWPKHGANPSKHIVTSSIRRAEHMCRSSLQVFWCL